MTQRSSLRRPHCSRCACRLAACQPPVEPADLVVTNGKIVTVDDGAGRSTGDRRSRRSHRRARHAGRDSALRRTDHRGDRRRRAAGDSRASSRVMATSPASARRSSSSSWRTANTWDDILAMVENAAKTAKPGQWIYGRGWHQEKWTAPPTPNVEGFPTDASLSRVSPNNPVLLTHASGHASFANALAMKLSGLRQRPGIPRAASS